MNMTFYDYFKVALLFKCYIKVFLTWKWSIWRYMRRNDDYYHFIKRSCLCRNIKKRTAEIDISTPSKRQGPGQAPRIVWIFYDEKNYKYNFFITYPIRCSPTGIRRFIKSIIFDNFANENNGLTFLLHEMIII